MNAKGENILIASVQLIIIQINDIPLLRNFSFEEEKYP